MATDFWDLVEQEKKKKKFGTTTTKPTGAFGDMVEKYKKESAPFVTTKKKKKEKEEEDDIAPVKTRRETGSNYGMTYAPGQTLLEQANDVAPVKPMQNKQVEARAKSRENYSLDELKKLKAEADDQGDKLKYTQMYNSKYIEEKSKVLASTQMDGAYWSVLQEMEYISKMDSGEEKDKRKEAVLKKMDELGIDTKDYALYAGDDNFTWGEFGKFLKNSATAGLASFNSGIASTANLILGKPLQAMGWENNPITKAADYYKDSLNAFTYDASMNRMRMGDGEGYGGWDFAQDAITGTVGALPNAIAALITRGMSLSGNVATTAVPTASSLANNAAMQTGNVLTKAGLTTEAMMKNPHYWLSFARTYGNDYEEAKERGASETAAVLGATITSLINAGIEIGPDGASGIQGLPDDLLSGDKNKVWAWIESSFEEGGEEGLQKFVNEIVTKTMYDHEADILNPLEYAKEMGLGTVSGLALGGGQMVADSSINAYNQHQANKLTEDEKAVVDKATEALIAEREKKYGRKLTNKEKTEAQKEVRENLEHGGLDVDSIAEILGGESYEAYKAESDSFFGSDAFKAYEEATRNEKLLPSLQEKYDKLNAIMPEKKTGAQQNEEATLLERINAIKNAPKSSDLKAKIDPVAHNRLMESYRKMHLDALARVKGTRLAESYAEHARSLEKLDIDVSKYTDENARKTVQAIIDSGLGDNSNAFKHFVDLVAQISAKHKTIYFDMTSNKRLFGTDHSKDGLTTNGYKLTDENGTTIVINKDAANPLRVVVGHEFAHVLEKSGFYDAMADSVLKFAELKEGKANLDARIQEATRIYKDDKNTTPQKEVVADLIGEYVFTDYEFISNLAKTNRKGFMKLFDEIKYLSRIATAGSKEARELAKAKNNFERAYRELNVADTKADTEIEFDNDDVQHSVSVQDKETLDFLDEQISKGEYDAEKNPDGGYYVTYKSMSFWGYDKDGNAILRSPMAEYVDGELSNAYLIPKDKSKLNWYQSTETMDENTGLPTGLMVKTKKPGNKSFSYVPAAENQDLIAEDWSNLYFNLKKKVLKNGKWVDSDVPARYNPYEHSSNSMLNDQFSSAYLRDNLVTVKMYVPVSEDNGTYRAQWSKDATGWADWKSGIVAGKINKQKDLQRRVYLSRYAAPVEIVPDSEVAQAYKEYIDGTDVSIPDNVVPPNLLNELRKAGVPIEESGKVQYSLSDSDGNQLTKEQQEFFKDSKMRDAQGNLLKVYHGTTNNFTTFRQSKADGWGTGIYFTDNREEASTYGDNVVEAYLNITNPYNADTMNYYDIGAENTRAYRDYDMSVWKNQYDEYDTYEEYKADGRGVDMYDIYAEEVEVFNKILRELGYDGIIADGSNGIDGKEIVAFRENQPKLTTNVKPTADPDIRYSLSDSEGNQLTKEQADFFKDSKARDRNGNLLKVYHTTNNDFTVFDKGRKGETTGDYNTYLGFFFADTPEYMSQFPEFKDGKTETYYLNMKNPIDMNNISKQAFLDIVEATGGDIQEAADLYDQEYADELKRAKFRGDNSTIMEMSRLLEEMTGEYFDYAEFYNALKPNYDQLMSKGYDGIINTLDGRGWANEYIVLDSNQAKLTSNKNPTKDPDIRFSFSKPVEQTKDLVALHNLTADKLLKSLELGGLPMPSIAITKADIPHDNFGDITLILGKDSIDPKANKKNVVYSADAWTPTFPRVEYEADSNVEKQLNKKLLDLATKVEDPFKHDLDMLRYGHEDNLNRYGGEEGYIQYVMEKYGMKAAYLEDQGHHIENVTKQVEVEKGYNSANEAKYQAIADILGITNADEIGKLNLKETKEQYGEQLEDIYPGMTKSAMRMSGIFRQVMAYMEDRSSAPVYRTVTDESAMRKAVDDAIDMEGFEAWTRNLFSGIVKDRGIYNNKDLFTPSGNRRSFKQTHLPFTLENIVKAMVSQNHGNTKNVSGFNGIKSLRAGTAERFKSIEVMHERKGRLQHLTQEEADKINDDLSTRLFSIIETIDNESGNHGESNSFIRFDSIGEILMEVSEGGKYNVADIQKVFAQYRHNISDDLATDIKQLLFDVSQMPVNIYEAKPERAVSFDEVGVFVIPRNADVKLKQELLNRGYSIAEYDPEVEGDRNKVVNQFEEYRFSLSDAGKEQSAESKFLKYTRGAVGRNSFADTIADLAPVRQDAITEESSATAAPVSQTAEEMFPDDHTSLDAELDSLNQRKVELEEQMLEMSRNENFDNFQKVSAEWETVRQRIEALEQEIAEDEAGRMDSLMEEIPPVPEEQYNDGQADVIPLTKKTLTDVARDVRNRLMLSNKDMYDVHKIIEDYSQSEFPSREQLFEELKDRFGTYTDSTTEDSIKEAKAFIRKYRLFVSDSVKKEIPDYADTMRRNRGRILFANDGMDVNSFYVDELTPRWSHLFPESIDVQTDQFNQIVKVANMDASTEAVRQLDDEAIWEVADSIIQGISEYRQAQKETAANKNARESFNSLMRDADEYVPPLEEDIAPVAAPVAEIAPTADKVAPVAEQPSVEVKKADKPINEALAAKIAGFQTELDNNRRLREESAVSFDQEIARLQAEYNAKKNKNTLGANDLLRRIERMKRLKRTVDAEFGKKIGNLEARIEKMSTPEYQTAEQRRTKMQEHTEFWKNILGDTSTWKDLALGLSYKTQTLRRILRKVVRDANGNPDIGKADMIYDALETKYDHNEALLKRESVKLKEVFQKLKLNHAEDTYAHMLGEFRYNPETTLTEDMVKDYYNKHKGRIDTKKVNTAITEARKTFDDLLVRVNEVLKAQGMKEIPYRKGYFPHFQNPKQNWFQKLINWKPVDNEIPTSIAGLTEMFEPQRSWQSFNKQRKGDTTDYSLYQGLDTYIHGALDWIYHIDDLQSRRALENHIRYIHSEEGVKAKIEAIKADETYDADQAQAMIDAVLNEASNPLNNLVQELMRRTNTLANKKASGDRKMESDFNRKVYSTMTNLNNRINANMVVGSFSSALTNFIPMVQSWHQVSPYFTLRGLGDYVRSVVKDDGMIEKSDFLTNRLVEEEKLYQTGWDKAIDKAAFMMQVIDGITSQTVWRSKYLQNLKEGMSESQAIKDADQFAKNLMAGRSRGNMPTIFDEKNPFTKIFTAFQLEVANQYGYMFDDVVKDSKNPLRLVKGYATAFLGAYLYNAVYSSLVGRDAAFDPMGIIEDLLRDLGVGDDDDEEEVDVGDTLLGLGENILQEVPFVGGLLGGGRIPLSSAMPYNGDFGTMFTDAVDGEFQVKELLKPLYYLALPAGGGQIKKTVEGLSMFSDDHPVAGSYTNSGKLRFPVEDTIGNRVQAAMFGQYASKNARYYFDNDIAPLGEKQIQEYKDVDLPIRDYWDYRKGLQGKDTLGEKLAYIDSLDLPIRKQNILANNLTDRKEPIDMADWDKYDGLEEYNYAKKYPEKHKFLESIGISYDDYESFDDDTKEAYSWAYQNPKKYTMSKAVTSDLMEYKQYTKALSAIKADKDAYGDTISGSAKEKKIDYINSLNLDYGQKIILYRSLYDGQADRDQYNADILEYLNGRNDLTFEEKVTILRELDFTVLDDGTVQWD